MTCSNCSSEAMYVLEQERVSTVYYCGRHLPAHLRQAASKGHLTIPVKPKKKAKTVVEEPVVEEPVIEEQVIEEPVVDEAPVEEPAVEEPVVEETLVEDPEA